VDKA